MEIGVPISNLQSRICNRSILFLRSTTVPRAVFIHINNTNPMLVEDSPEWQRVHEAGAEIGWDGMDFEV